MINRSVFNSFFILFIICLITTGCEKDKPSPAASGTGGGSGNNNTEQEDDSEEDDNSEEDSTWYVSDLPPLGSGNGEIDCEQSEWYEIIDGDMVISFVDMPLSGNFEWVEITADEGPELIVWDESENGDGDVRYATSGSGSWSGSTLTFDAVLKHEYELEDPTAETYSLNGQFVCP